jgi:HEAT repeat protein
LPAAAGREGLRFVQSRDARQQELRGLSSADPNERAAAACALGRSASAAAIPALARLLGDGSPIPESDCWPSGDWNPALKSLRHPSPGEQAAIALASFGAPAVAVLLDALESSNPTVRSNAAWAIGEVRGGGSVDRSAAIDPLVHALTDLDPWVRKAAAFSLGEMRPRRAAGALVNALGDADATVREMAARALGELKVRNAVERLAATLLGDADAHVRRTAAWALGEIQDRSALPALVAATSDENAEVRTMVAWAISEVNQQ